MFLNTRVWQVVVHFCIIKCANFLEIEKHWVLNMLNLKTNRWKFKWLSLRQCNLYTDFNFFSSIRLIDSWCGFYKTHVFQLLFQKSTFLDVYSILISTAESLCVVKFRFASVLSFEKWTSDTSTKKWISAGAGQKTTISIVRQYRRFQ